jgi:hypothetical protein
LVELTKTVDKPVYNKQIKEVFVDKVVETRVEVPVEKYVEVPRVTEQDQHIEVNNHVQVARNIHTKNVK